MSGDVIGTVRLGSERRVSALCSAAAAMIASIPGDFCIPPDIQIVFGNQILPNDTRLEDVGFGPSPEVTAVRVAAALPEEDHDP